MNNISKRYSMILIIIAVSLAKTLPAQECVRVWYGNLDGSPINAEIGELVDIDIYLQAAGDVYIGDMYLCLGALDQYFDSLLSEVYGEFYPPFNELYSYEFLPQYAAPPDPYQYPAGWSSQSVWISGLNPEHPWIHLEYPTRVLKMVFEAANNPSYINDTVECLGEGIFRSMAGDTLGWQEYPIIESYSPVYFMDSTTNIDDYSVFIPDKFTLAQAYPNPFNASTTISYTLPYPTAVTIDIYDILGRKVETLINAKQEAGHHQAVWNADYKTSGMYFYKIQAGDFKETKKMLLLK